MILIGMFDSPFVRRVAVSMNVLGMKFEHRNWSVGKDFESIRQYNPLGRVPTLVPNDGEALLESSAILDFLDESAGERALLPRSGIERREALRILAIATGAAEKGVAQVYETAFRTPQNRFAPWVDRCRTQTLAALAELERMAAIRMPAARSGEWFMGARMMQPDITATCVFTFLIDAISIENIVVTYPVLAALAARCEALPQFRSVRAPWLPPRGPAAP